MIDFDQQDQANYPRLDTPAFQKLIGATLSRRQMMLMRQWLPSQGAMVA
ncbi:MAG: hypothetical protein ACOVNN_08800 [Limnohabitans sp.]|jgi:hypothetical protein